MKHCWLLFLTAFLFSCGQTNTSHTIDRVAQTDTASTPLDKINQQILDNPNNPDLYFERAKAYLAQNDRPAALSDVGRAIRLDSLKVDYYLLLADLKLMGREATEAKETLEKAISVDNTSVEAYLKMGELHMLAEDYDASFSYINDALKLDVYNARAYTLKGFNYKFLGDTANAVSSFQTAVEQNPEEYDAYMQLGLIYSAAPHPIAIDYFDNALRIDPQSLEALYAKGMYYQENNEPRKALEMYNAILEIDPQYYQAHYNQGYVYLEIIHEYDSARMAFDNAITSGPRGYFTAYYNKGLASERAGNMDAAEANYRQALHLNPQYDLAAKGLTRIGR